MEREEIIEKVMQKKEFSELPKADILKAFGKFDNEHYSDEEKVKKTRDFLRKAFSGFSGQKLLVYKDKSPDEVLKKHLSTRERYEYYEEIYERLLKNLPKDISVLDLGCGVNGFAYDFFEKVGKKVNYVGIEAVGQLVELMKKYFEKESEASMFSSQVRKKEKMKNAKAIHMSLFELEKLKETIESSKKPRVLFLFKVIDSLEKVERNYTKTLLKEIVPLADKIVISFATQSWARRRKFFANRKWLIDFIRDNWQFTDDFEIAGERYVVFEK